MESLLGATLDLATCWMIGDRHHDIDAATEVGTRSMGVLWGFGSREELTGAGAHAVAESPQDILTHFS
jgi:phosphoglycolate phosphatase